MEKRTLQTIGFVGLGVMGKSMAANLMKAGYTLLVFTRTKEKAEDLIKEGASWIPSVKELAEQADVVITMVGYPSDVEEIYFGEKGILAGAGPGSYVVDMTTSKPKLARSIYDQAKEKNIHAVDAPVSGGDIGARGGTLAIMAGGDKEAFDALAGVFEAMGSNIKWQGEAGAGQHTKMSNQIVIASTMMGVAEAMVYAKAAGLNQEEVLESIGTGAASSWSLTNLAPRMIKGDNAPGFYVKHFIKDMGIAIESAEELGIETPGLRTSKKVYEAMAEAGEEDSGTQAIYKYLLARS
ncbi:3-hydroxyisobutyrate dehydrogenase [Sinobaca qinghaiensis]|uniref:3-hydroxyisobutyrate dehydrogenase n=1 Tax=Sinobaca qinghaiensis TaxID=342944 RepID=A0A419V4X0_9BACL|nr:NAD(P)-dependent oxidoreductase [Sinobaca qinghaiensis]RKD73426.1 3-hydroxyisobutyrate dehydrogenase [Sinobaca qinghaiensis]